MSTGSTGITGDFTTLMNQAPTTMREYLREGIEAIDYRLGEGYAKEHPELLAAFISGCTSDYNNASSMKVFGEAIHKLVDGVESIANEMNPHS